jgi:hypothetical protein
MEIDNTGSMIGECYGTDWTSSHVAPFHDFSTGYTESGAFYGGGCGSMAANS